MRKKLPEVWQRGPIDGVQALLQPVAHALMQASEELNEMMSDFPDSLLTESIAGTASSLFHLQHLTGVLDRLFTYARGEALTPHQLGYLANEGKQLQPVSELLSAFDAQVDKALAQLKGTDENTLKDARGVGRAQIPSTVIGLLVHAAEHTMRHVGQLLVTVRVLKGG